MMNEPSSIVNRGHITFFSGLTVDPVDHMTVVEVSHIELIAVGEELPAVCERLDDVVEPAEEHYSDGAPVAQEMGLQPQGTILEDIIIEELDETQLQATEVVRTVDNYTSELRQEIEEPTTRTLSNKNNIQSEIGNKGIDKDPKPTVGESYFVCVTCHRMFNEKYNVAKDIRTDTGEKPFQCINCYHKYVLGNRIETVKHHTCKKKPLDCDFCDRKFSSKGSLTNHIRTHSREKPYKCEICPRSFAKKNNLTNHTVTHTGEKYFKCDVCKRTFTKQQYFKAHIRTHTGEKPFECNICHHTFALKRYLAQHIVTHSERYKCDICELKFTRKTSLREHVLTHSGEKPFECVSVIVSLL